MALTLPFLANAKSTTAKPSASPTVKSVASSSPPRVPYNNGLYAGPYNPSVAPLNPRPAPQQVVDPYAAARAAQAAEDARKEADRIAGITRQVAAGQEGIQTGGATTLRDITNTYGTNNRNTVQSIQAGQEGINRTRENTALNLRRGMSGIVDQIRSGVRSGGVQLANMNASDSGATEALGRAYAKLGNQQVGDIRNEAFLENRDTDVQQRAIDQQEQNALADFATYRTTEMDRVSNDLFSQLRTLDANAAAQGVNGKVDLGIRDRLINDAIAKLNAVDQQTTQALGGINPLSQDQIYANASQLDAAGQSGGNPFSYQLPQSGQATPAYNTSGNIPIAYRKDPRLGV